MPRRTSATAQAAPSVTTTFTMPPTAPAADATEKSSEERPDFFTYMHGLTPEQWKRHIVYLTREMPKTSITGVGGYLTKLQQAFDIEDIKQAFGGQEFSYLMKRDNDLIYSGRFRVEAPPKFDSQREAPNGSASNGHSDGTSQLLQQFVGVLRDELARSREGRSDSASEEAIKMLSSASERAMEVITKQIPQAGDPASQLTALLGAAEKIAAMRAPANGGGMSSTLEKLLEAVLPKLLEKFLAPTDPFEQITKLAGVFEVIEKLRGPGAGGKTDWRTALVEEGVPAVRDLVTVLAERRKAELETTREQRLRAEANARTSENARQINEQRLSAANAPRPAAAAAPAPVAPAVAAVPATPFRVVPMPSNGEPAVPAPTEEIPAGSVAANADEFLKGVKVRFVELMASGDDSEFIVDFLEAARPDMIPYLTNYSPQQITAYFQADPILAHAVALPRWKEWLEDARAYLTEEPEPAGKVN